ncbi:hypothetical protein [Nonomuraea sp. NPDC049141]|uniref:hypothetical protein n=1 Tax=Nonomuraea sp. NPDC049141 TaxID=3155500 RepID=UPI0033E1431A
MPREVPADAATPCTRDGCGGTLEPVEDEAYFGIEGDAHVLLRCSSRCGMESVHYFGWEGEMEAWADYGNDWPEV